MVKLQQLHWHPVLKSIEDHFSIQIQYFTSLLHGKQSPETHKKLLQHVQQFSSIQLAGKCVLGCAKSLFSFLTAIFYPLAFEKAVMTCKSFLIPLALIQRLISIDEAVTITRLESIAQQKTWGMVEEAHIFDHEETRKNLSIAYCCFHFDSAVFNNKSD